MDRQILSHDRQRLDGEVEHLPPAQRPGCEGVVEGSDMMDKCGHEKGQDQLDISRLQCTAGDGDESLEDLVGYVEDLFLGGGVRAMMRLEEGGVARGEEIVVF